MDKAAISTTVHSSSNRCPHAGKIFGLSHLCRLNRLLSVTSEIDQVIRFAVVSRVFTVDLNTRVPTGLADSLPFHVYI